MPNKTLSMRAGDLALWERAERAARAERTTVSALVASALAERLGGIDVCQVGLRESETSSRIEAFEGRWLTQAPAGVEGWDDQPSWRSEGHLSDEKAWTTYVAETKRGRIAVYVRYAVDAYDRPTLFRVFDDIDAAQQALTGDTRVNPGAFADARRALGRNGQRGREIRWRDI